MPRNAGEITRLLRRAANPKDEEARERLYELVEAELRNTAAGLLRRTGHDPLLERTDLVNETYARLIHGERGADWRDRKQFFCTASVVMRNLRVDSARRRAHTAAGVGPEWLPDGGAPPPGDGLHYEEMVLALNDALDGLAKADPEAAQLFQVRYFGRQVVRLAGGRGEETREHDAAALLAAPARERLMTLEEVAGVFGVSVATAFRVWKRATEWLGERLAGFHPEGGPS